MRLLALAACAALASADEITGRVLDATGAPVAEASVTLHAGWARYALAPDFDRWLSIATKTATTAADGRFAFADLPAGTRATVFVRAGDRVGVGEGAGALEVRLGAAGAVRGRVLGKRQDLKALRVVVEGGRGLGGELATVDKKTGSYEVGGLAPGQGRVVVRYDNFVVAEQEIEVAAGRVAKARSVKFRGKYRPGPDPVVDCLKARLVDAAGDPVPGVQLWWSSRSMDGGMASDDDGMVKLAGGGVAIGGPPYVLRLARMDGAERVYTGALRRVRRGVAIVEVRPLVKVTGTVVRGEAAVARYRLFAVATRVRAASVEEGRYTVFVPAGTVRLVVGPPDGRVHESTLDVAGAIEHEIRVR